MLRIGMGCFLAAFVVDSGRPVQAQARPSCTYEQCVAACQKMGGGGRQFGCSGYCDKAIRERKARGQCK